MRNKSKNISASEINTYCFCPYQWYYKRLYGNGNLIKLKNEKLKELNLQNNYKKDYINNFKRGNLFHNTFLIKLKFKLFLKILILITVFIFIIALSLGNLQ